MRLWQIIRLMPDYLNGHHPDMVVPGYRVLSQLKLYSFKKENIDPK